MCVCVCVCVCVCACVCVCVCVFSMVLSTTSLVTVGGCHTQSVGIQCSNTFLYLSIAGCSICCSVRLHTSSGGIHRDHDLCVRV